MTATRARPLVALAACVLFAAAPSTATASDDCINAWYELVPAFTDTVPADGVLAIRSQGDGPLTSLEATVYPNLSEPIDGALEWSEGILVWRPAAPLTPGVGYTLHLRADNSNYDWLAEQCGFPLEIDVLAEFTATDPGRPTPRWDALEARHWVERHPSTAHEDIVCCDGEVPNYTPYYGYSLGQSCATTRENGRLHAAVTIDPAAWSEAQGQLVYHPFYEVADEVELIAADGSALPCLDLVAADLSTHAIHRGPTICPDPALAEELGEYVVDPRDTLTCDKLQTCEEREDFGGWDPDKCQRWRGEGGCGCATDERGGAASLGLFVLLAALRRRRRSRSASAPNTDTPRSRG